MKKIVTLFSLLFLFNTAIFSQTDSLHMMIKDTILKAGDIYTVQFEFRENLSDIIGFQFCIGYDPFNLQFNSVKQIHIPVITQDDIIVNPLGNTDKISSLGIMDIPYDGTKIFDLAFNVLNDCRIKNVIQILPLYRFKESESFISSEAYDLDGNTLPIATEYLPFVELSNRKNFETIKASVFPNPSSNIVNFEFNNLTNEQTGHLNVFDISGRKINSKIIELAGGINTHKLDRTDFGPAGQYIIRLQLGNRMISGQINIVD